MSESQLEVYRQHILHRSKYNYFMLGSAGACVAFAMSQTESIELSWPNQPMLAALFCWAISLVSGIIVLRTTGKVVSANFQLISFQQQSRPEYHAAISQIASEETIEPMNVKLTFWENLQLGSLLIGAACLVLWKVAAAYPNFSSLIAALGS